MITYQKEITKLYKSLNSNSQFKLWNKIQNGDSNARNQVINSCLPLAFKLADKFHKNNKHIDLEDLMGEANLALINAVDKWDINKSNITTIATHCIKNALINTIHDSKYNIRFPVSFSRRAADQLYKVIGSTKQLAEEIIEMTNSSSKVIYTPLPKDDPLKFEDNKKYIDRLKSARKITKSPSWR